MTTNNFIAIALLILASYLYMKLAIKFNIIDKPNERSSHITPTIRGGGILFPLAILLFFVFNGFPYPYFVLGLILVATISFLDDIYTLGSGIRMTIQLISIVLCFYEIGGFDFSVIIIFISLFFATGLLNIYNFMDGINGITGIYSIAVILPLIYLENVLKVTFINSNLLILTLAAILIFGYSNFRKNAKSFAGDIGSISIGLVLIFCVGKLIITSQNLHYILFFLVYLLDGGYTILERAYKKENILKPHRRHLYQLLTDNKNFAHLKTSSIYGLYQLIIASIIIISIHYLESYTPIYIMSLLTIILYIVIKNKILKNG